MCEHRLIADGNHRVPLEPFLAAGGQTRPAERGPIDPLLDAIRDQP